MLNAFPGKEGKLTCIEIGMSATRDFLMIAPNKTGRGSCKMPNSELHNTLQSIYQADERAFERLFGAYRWRVFSYLRRLGASYEQSEDVLQDTFLNAYSALRSGKYRHVNEVAFAAWLRTIARHLMFHWVAAGESVEQPAPISVENESTVDPAGEVIEPGPGPDSLAEQSELLAFLNEQLDELLIHSQFGQKDKDTGLLKKEAFMRFYLDGLSQREILKAAIEDAARLGMVPEMTSATVKNWISRGDILKSLVGLLVVKYPGVLDKLRHTWLKSPDLTDEERDVLQMEWELSKRPQEIGVSRSLPLSIVTARLASAKVKVTDRLFSAVKRDLHQSRST